MTPLMVMTEGGVRRRTTALFGAKCLGIPPGNRPIILH